MNLDWSDWSKYHWSILGGLGIIIGILMLMSWIVFGNPFHPITAPLKKFKNMLKQAKNTSGRYRDGKNKKNKL